MSRLDELRRLRADTREVPYPGEPRRPFGARVPPGTRAEIGPVNAAICAALGRVAGTGQPPHVFTTLARHRRIFRPWLRFAGRLMPAGRLARRDAELVILRVAVLCGSDYEWTQHSAIGQRAGLTAEEVARVGRGPGAGEWPDRDRALLAATDELVDDHALSEATWRTLCTHLAEDQRIELCLLAGHYAMLAGTLNALGVEPER